MIGNGYGLKTIYKFEFNVFYDFYTTLLYRLPGALSNYNNKNTTKSFPILRKQDAATVFFHTYFLSCFTLHNWVFTIDFSLFSTQVNVLDLHECQYGASSIQQATTCLGLRIDVF